MSKLKTLVTDPFEDDVKSILEWAYGPPAKYSFIEKVAMGQRTGQAFMNVLCYFDEDEYNRLSGSLVDPFYQDKNIPAALDKLTSK